MDLLQLILDSLYAQSLGTRAVGMNVFVAGWVFCYGAFLLRADVLMSSGAKVRRLKTCYSKAVRVMHVCILLALPASNQAGVPKKESHTRC